MNVADEGIFIFDNQGNFLKKLAIITNQRMCFFKEHMLWIQDNQIMAFSITNQELMNLGPTPASDYAYLQLGKEVLALVGNQKIELYLIPISIKNL